MRALLIQKSLSSLLAFIRSGTARALLRTFLARGVVSFGALGLVVVVGHLYGPQGVGVYALAQSILLGAGILSRRGMDSALIRFVGRDHEARQVRGFLYWAGWRSLWVSAPLMLVVCFGRGLAEDFFGMPGLAVMLLGIGLAVPLYTWSFLLAGFFKGVRKPAMAAMQENGAIALVAGALLLGLQWWLQGPLALAVLGWVYLAAALLIAAQGHLTAMRWLRRVRRPPAEVNTSAQTSAASTTLSPVDLASLRSVSQSFFVISLAAFMHGVLSIMIAGKFLGSTELGLFKSAQQIGLSVAFVLMVINAIFPPRFATLYHQGKMAALGGTARRAALLGVALSAPFLLVCLLVPEWVLGLLGEGFESAALLLRIVALAQLVNVATGSVGFLLNMTGHDRVMRNIALLCNSVGVAGFLLLTPFLGALGAALALAFVLVAQNLVAMVAVWIKLGIWTMPGPNWLAMLGIKSHAGAARN